MPVDRGALDAQLRAIGEGERWWEHREFRELPYVLHENEGIQAITTGKLLGRRRPRLGPSSRWLFVATDERLLCLKHERFARKQVDIVWGQITRAHQGASVGSYQITISTQERRYRLRIPKDAAIRFTGAIAPFIPRPAGQGLPDELEALSWIPGITTVAAFPPFAGVLSKVAMLSPPTHVMKDQVERLEATVDRLQNDVERLQKQVAFLEDLLQNRTSEPLISQTTEDS